MAGRKYIPVIDLQKRLSVGRIFSDDCQFNKNGSVAGGKILAAFITPLVYTFQYK